ncbi:TPA_asm: hypothetical protein [Porphyromonas phage phage006a_EM3]
MSDELNPVREPLSHIPIGIMNGLKNWQLDHMLPPTLQCGFAYFFCKVGVAFKSEGFPYHHTGNSKQLSEISPLVTIFFYRDASATLFQIHIFSAN